MCVCAVRIIVTSQEQWSKFICSWLEPRKHIDIWAAVTFIRYFARVGEFAWLWLCMIRTLGDVERYWELSKVHISSSRIEVSFMCRGGQVGSDWRGCEKKGLAHDEPWWPWWPMAALGIWLGERQAYTYHHHRRLRRCRGDVPHLAGEGEQLQDESGIFCVVFSK